MKCKSVKNEWPFECLWVTAFSIFRTQKYLFKNRFANEQKIFCIAAISCAVDCMHPRLRKV